MRGDANPQQPAERVVERVDAVDLSRVGLTSQEGFVLSRIDGNTPVEWLCAITGLGESATLATVQALAQKGVIVAIPPFEGVRGRAEPHEPSERPEPARSGRPASSTASTTASTVGESAHSTDDLLDQEEHQGIDLKRETRIRVREMRGCLRTLSFFDLLGVPLDADVKAIRRGYFDRSKEFHPDRYYTKNLGPYKEMLAEIFRQVKAAYEFLLDDTKRAAYRSTIEQQLQKESLERQVSHETDQALRLEDRADEQVEAIEQRERAATDAGLAPAEPRARNSAVTSFMKRHLRDQFRHARPQPATAPTRPSGSAPPTGSHARRDTDRGLEGVAPAEPALEAREDSPARATRRELDRICSQRVRKKTLTVTLSQRRQKAIGFFEQGMKQLSDNKPLAATASLKLAVSFDPENKEYQARFEIASEAARGITAENSFKRALFEESVGRYETAAAFFQEAADALPREPYLLKATQSAVLTGELIKARDYATKATQLAQDSVEARLSLARVLLAMGQKKAARREADLAKKLSPANAEVKELLKQIKRS